jgi:hypothetical protein
MLRVLNELADRLGVDGLPGRKLATAMASARAKARAQIVARHGQLPAGVGRRDQPDPPWCRSGSRRRGSSSGAVRPAGRDGDRC